MSTLALAPPEPRSDTSNAVLAIAIFAAIASSPWACAQCAYNAFILEQPAAWSAISIDDMNSAGTVVGAFTLPFVNKKRSYQWNPATGFVELPSPPGALHTQPKCINDAGTVAGYVTTDAAYNQNLMVWNAELPFVPPPETAGIIVQAFVINSSGVVGGYINGFDLPLTPFLWSNGAYIWLDSVFGDSNVLVRALSDAGWFGGNWSTSTFSDNGPCIASMGAFIQLPMPRGYFNGTTHGISPRLNAIVNFTGPAASDGSHPPRGFFWDGSSLTALDFPAGMEIALAADMNEVEQIVGYTGKHSSPAAQDIPTLWQDGARYDLRTLTVIPSNIVMHVPMTVLNDGRILVDARRPATGSVVGVILTSTTINEDITLDCAVDARDLHFVLDSWGPVGPMTVRRADVDGDGVVGGYDLAAVLGAWTPTRSNPPRGR